MDNDDNQIDNDDFPYAMPGMDYDGFAAPEGTQAQAGEPLEDGSDYASQDDVVAALREIYDPEIPVNIFDLGLIYECDMDELGNINILMTLTAPACPVAGEMPQQVADKCATVAGVGIVVVTLTWEPAWSMQYMSDDARLALGF